LSRALYDIAQLLESADGADARVRHVLELLRGLVPYEQCAILEARPGHEPRVVMVPESSSGRPALTETLLHTFGQLIDAKARAPGARPKGARLAVPLVGLDEVIGLLFVCSSVVTYTEEHLHALSVIAAKLAAYFTTLRARAELTALARQRDEARRAAEAANRAKDEFLALVSHELKTPLSSIVACAEILRSPADDAARSRASDELQRNVQAQTELIDDILQLACIVSATLRLNLRITEPAELIKATIERLRLAAERKSVSLECTLDTAAMPLVLDPERIGQVVSILVAGAIKFTPPGGHVQVSLDRAAGYARIRVRDSGGIAAGALPHIFDPFRYPAGARAHADGLGVGLALVKDLVELHGGRVRAESAGPEKGATFTVELPHAAEAVPGRLSASEGAASLLSGIRVLLVDHDRALRESFQSVLDDYGAEVTAVGSAPEALGAIERSRPDVLLFGDLARRDDSVYELMREVTARACPLPVASISAWRLERERELAAGFRMHLLKPLEMGALVEAVLRLAGRPPGRAPRPRSREQASR
jgi:signal transduction histidine kinase/CheY-like chemotaxis protein